MFLCVETIGVSTTSNNVFKLIVKGLFEFNGLGLEELVGKLVNMGCGGSNVFQGHKTSVTFQFKENLTPFLNGVHYFAHKTI